MALWINLWHHTTQVIALNDWSKLNEYDRVIKANSLPIRWLALSKGLLHFGQGYFGLRKIYFSVGTAPTKIVYLTLWITLSIASITFSFILFSIDLFMVNGTAAYALFITLQF